MENKDKFLEIEEKKDEAGLGNPEELKRMLWLISRATAYVSSGVTMIEQLRSRASRWIVLDTGAPRHTTIQPACISIAQSCDS